MSIQEKKGVGFPLAFEVYSYDIIDWDNPPLTSEYPYLEDELLEILLYYCLDHSVLEYILFPAKQSIIAKSFFKEQEQQPKLFTDNQKIRQRVNYFIQKMLRNQCTVIGTSSDIAPFLNIFKKAYWAIDGISIERAMCDINCIVKDQLTLSTIAKLPCKNLIFINHDGEPIYLLHHSQFSQVIDI